MRIYKIGFHPEPEGEKVCIKPIFLPYQGCPEKCVYCAQPLQTGIRVESLKASRGRLENMLVNAERAQEAPFETAFFGGTFTCLPEKEIQEFLETVGKYKRKGIVSRIRCSTRPDAVNGTICKQLKLHGMDMIELGVQSFSEKALQRSKRGYGAPTIYKACQSIQDSGLELGIQLMPGMPGQAKEDFVQDIEATIHCKPRMVRLYPCLVIRGTELAKWWEKGEYVPWSLEQTVECLSEAVYRLWRAGIRIGRIGLAPEQSLQNSILAGPQHAALGSKVRGKVLQTHIKSMIKGRDKNNIKLRLPLRYQGEFFGDSKELVFEYERIKIKMKHVSFWNREFILAEIH